MWQLIAFITAGLYFTDEQNGLWSGNDDLVFTISPLDEAHVDRRGKVCLKLLHDTLQQK